MNVTSIGSTIKQTVFTLFRVLRVDDEGRLEVVNPVGSPNDVNVAEYGGTVPPSAGLAGVTPVGGTGADGAAPTATYSVRVAGIVRAVKTLLTDTYKQSLLLSTYGELLTRDAAHDVISATMRGSVNTIADDRDQDGAPQIIASETNTAAGTYQYPNAGAGLEVGNNKSMTFGISCTDITALTFWHSIDGTWAAATDITQSVRVLTYGGAYGFSSFVSPGVSSIFKVRVTGLDGGSLYWQAVYPDGTNALSVKKVGRA